MNNNFSHCSKKQIFCAYSKLQTAIYQLAFINGGKELFPAQFYLRNTSSATYTHVQAHKFVVKITGLHFSEAESRVAANIQFSPDILNRTPCTQLSPACTQILNCHFKITFMKITYWNM